MALPDSAAWTSAKMKLPLAGASVAGAPHSGAPFGSSLTATALTPWVHATTTLPSLVPAIFGAATISVVSVSRMPPPPHSRVPEGSTLAAAIYTFAPLSSRKASSALPAVSTARP